MRPACKSVLRALVERAPNYVSVSTLSKATRQPQAQTITILARLVHAEFAIERRVPRPQFQRQVGYRAVASGNPKLEMAVYAATSLAIEMMNDPDA